MVKQFINGIDTTGFTRHTFQSALSKRDIRLRARLDASPHIEPEDRRRFHAILDSLEEPLLSEDLIRQGMDTAPIYSVPVAPFAFQLEEGDTYRQGLHGPVMVVGRKRGKPSSQTLYVFMLQDLPGVEQHFPRETHPTLYHPSWRPV